MTGYETIRYSPTREAGAAYTAATKLTYDDKRLLHTLAVEQGISDYELTRRVLVRYLAQSVTKRGGRTRM